MNNQKILLEILFLAVFLSGCAQNIETPQNTSMQNISTENEIANETLATNISPFAFKKLMDDDIKLGNDTAPLIVIEFADFQCPVSRKWWTESFRIFEKEYIQTGKVQFIYRDFPLYFHPHARLGAEAAECADEQGKWKEMHNAIFREQNKIGKGTVDFEREDVERWAERIEGLDAEAFRSCLNSSKYEEEINDDIGDGAAIGIKATPSFIIGKRNSSAEILVGAYEYTEFKEKIEKLLEE